MDEPPLAGTLDPSRAYTGRRYIFVICDVRSSDNDNTESLVTNPEGSVRNPSVSSHVAPIHNLICLRIQP